MLLAAMLLFSPLTWTHAYVLLLFSLVWLFSDTVCSKRGNERTLLLIATLLLSTPDLFVARGLGAVYFPQTVPFFAGSLMLLPTVGLLLLFYLLLKIDIEQE